VVTRLPEIALLSPNKLEQNILQYFSTKQWITVVYNTRNTKSFLGVVHLKNNNTYIQTQSENREELGNLIIILLKAKCKYKTKSIVKGYE